MAISIPCPQCGQKLKALEEHVGRKAKCKFCQTVFVVTMPTAVTHPAPKPLPLVPLPPHAVKPPAAAKPPVARPAPPRNEPEVTPGGSVRYRYQEIERDWETPVTQAESFDQISAHVEQYIGPIEMVLHELVSDRVHLDVLWIKPNEDRDFHTYVTSGMSDLPMSGPAECYDNRFAEMVLCLPSNWPDVQREEAYWPIYWLKSLARFPHMYNSWLDIAHTVPNGDPPEPFAPDNRFCSWMVIPPMTVDEEFHALEINSLKTIHFLGMAALYQEELDFKLEKGFEELVERWAETEAEVSELLTIGRPNTCAERPAWPLIK